MLVPPRGVISIVLCAVLASACANLVSIEADPIDLEPVEQFSQSLVYAADGSVLATLRFDHREPVAWEDLPPHLIDAVVAAEDRRFFDHDGVDGRAIIRAWVANRRAGEVVQGGSTITQQLIKNRYFPDAAITLERKGLEARMALELEQQASKQQILTDYLNTVYFGSGAYGIEAAAQVHFATTTAALTVEQSVLLAAVIRAPEAANAFTAPDRAVAERRRVIGAMVEEGHMTAAQGQALDAAPLGLTAPPEPPETRHPFFVEAVKRQLTTDEHFGVTEADRWRRLFGGGLRIHTTLDPSVQAAADAASTAFWSGPADPEVAIAVVEPETGHVVATVGGRSFADRQFDLATQARRQPGSTFKVVGLAAAINQGWTLDDTIESSSGAFDVGEAAPWTVRSATEGEITLHEALVRSSNGAFARLALEVGGTEIEAMARAMGVTSPVGTNPSIVLGGLREGVSPLDMASVAATIANLGVHAPATMVSHITDADGVTVWEPRGLAVPAIDPESALEVQQAMEAAITEGTGQRASLGDRPAAGKTGTVQDNRDAWFVGYTREYAAAVWVGYPDAARPLVDVHGVAAVEGGTWPARIWRELYVRALDGQPPLPLRFPTDLLQTVLVDPETGGIATPYCPTTVELTALPGDIPRFYCPVHTQPLPQRPDRPTDEPTGTPDIVPAPATAPEPGATTAPEPLPVQVPPPDGDPEGQASPQDQASPQADPQASPTPSGPSTPPPDPQPSSPDQPRLN